MGCARARGSPTSSRTSCPAIASCSGRRSRTSISSPPARRSPTPPSCSPRPASPPGRPPPPRLASFVEEVRQGYDAVILDSSPLLAVTDASILASVVDGITLIVRLSATRRHDLERAVELLATLGTPVLGTVV